MTTSPRTMPCPASEDTLRLGELLGQEAAPGTVIALVGDLGAGKTVLARGVGAGLGVRTRVQSPTFILVQTHTGGRLPLWHADLYRLGDMSELDELGLEELMESGGVVLIEWADLFPECLPPDHLLLEIREEGEERLMVLEARGPRHQALVERLVR